MIKLNNIPLEWYASGALSAWQALIDKLPNYEQKVNEGKRQFKALNVRGNATFDHIKSILSEMCQGARRCGYCEDSVADEVEHIQPKDLYPEHVFSWDNYLYACGPCNQAKSNKFAILQASPMSLVKVTRRKNAPVVPPFPGSAALINPRFEDPLHFLILDIRNTFIFTIRDDDTVSVTDKLRADYTIRTLSLNVREYLIKARREAFSNYRARLREYILDKQNQRPDELLSLRKTELQRMNHRTVWREMQRQQAYYDDLRNLFAEAPEALLW